MIVKNSSEPIDERVTSLAGERTVSGTSLWPRKSEARLNASSGPGRMKADARGRSAGRAAAVRRIVGKCGCGDGEKEKDERKREGRS